MVLQSEFPLFSTNAVMGLASLGLLCVCVTLLFFRNSKKPLEAKEAVSTDFLDSEKKSADKSEKSIKLTVLYGTQTGTAEGFAKIFGEEAGNRYEKKLDVKILGLDEYAANDSEYNEKILSEAILVFFLATYGDGEPTDDAARFFKWLKAKSDNTEDEKAELLASDLKYAVFGLGNRQYEHFNAVGIYVDSRLKKLGAHQLTAVGKGDDDQCMEDDFNQWMSSLWSALDAVLKTSAPSAPSPANASLHEYRVEVHAEEDSRRPLSREEVARFHNPTSSTLTAWAQVSVCQELHSPVSERSCLHLELTTLKTSAIRYECGDHAAIHPENSEEVVQAAASALGLPPSLLFSLHLPPSSALPLPFPGPCTLRSALSLHADLLSSPKKSALLALAAHAKDADEAARLRHLASPAGKEEYQGWVVDPQRSLLEVMQAFPSARPPLGLFFAAVAPRLQPRFYSISSSPRLVGEHRLHITCAVVEETTPGGRLHKGVCSTWLKSFLPEAEAQSLEGPAAMAALPPRVPIFIRSSHFRLPRDPSTPVVMVGPGTGLAPFRAFLQERSALIGKGRRVGPALLFFGCRDRKKDFIYKEELEAFLEEGALSHLFVAYSREGEKKQYVQHVMQAEAGRMWSLLAEGGYFYVCGDAKSMAKDVHKTLLTIIQKRECVSLKEAEDLVKGMQDSGRYLRDVW